MQREPEVLLDLSAIVAESGASGAFSYALQLPPSEELVTEGPVAVSLEVRNIGKALLVYGKFSGRVRLACARCLRDVITDVAGNIDEQFSLPGITDPDLELIDQEEPQEAAFSKQILNVSELIRQELLISLPLRVLCQEDCKGLCPTCGQDLNEKQCDCPPEMGHPAWETLRELMEKKNK
jgi:uncharacterized protein